jgi:hypothetical protein
MCECANPAAFFIGMLAFVLAILFAMETNGAFMAAKLAACGTQRK